MKVAVSLALLTLAGCSWMQPNCGPDQYAEDGRCVTRVAPQQPQPQPYQAQPYPGYQRQPVNPAPYTGTSPQPVRPY